MEEGRKQEDFLKSSHFVFTKWLIDQYIVYIILLWLNNFTALSIKQIHTREVRISFTIKSEILALFLQWLVGYESPGC
ncbi:hypothetical protein ABE28_011815 [Peribacillus muralis]|uniref:Uncharacterized protein n=1 Tax=Peribacillus muralis TaxID=264697 RepID=A0A1B3XP92_9BACI|nr:hypothetical protein ABE28_011815 [Peribacillus muralis]